MHFIRFTYFIDIIIAYIFSNLYDLNAKKRSYDFKVVVKELKSKKLGDNV